jgi:hypothetical protein
MSLVLGSMHMAGDHVFADPTEVEADLALLENLTVARKEFLDRLGAESQSKEEQVLASLRMESTYLLAEFLYLLRARGLETEEQVKLLADLQNDYIVELMKDSGKMARLGLTRDRLLDAMFTADTMPRLIQHWRERPGAIDQSNLARFLVTLMSTETCRKVLVACEAAGFIERQKSSFGTVLVLSKGVLERLFGEYLRNLRGRMH